MKSINSDCKIDIVKVNVHTQKMEYNFLMENKFFWNIYLLFILIKPFVYMCDLGLIK